MLFGRISPLEKNLLRLAFASFIIKILVQSAVAVPFVAEAAYTIRNYVIGFIHLILLGAMTFFVMQQAGRRALLPTGRWLVRTGLYLLAAGFVLSEGILFLQGTLFWAAMGFLPFYYEALFGVSALMPLGILLLLAGGLLPTDRARS